MQAALEISTSLAAAHAQSLQQSLMGELDAQDAALPVMLHVQMTVEAAIQGVVPGHGHFSIDVRGANVAVTSYPVPPGASGRNVRASKPRLVKSVCVCFDHVEMQLVKHLLHSGPIVVASNVRANLLSSLVPASANARHGRFAGGGGARTGAGEDTGNDLKEEVLIMARKHESVTLCMDTLQLKSLQLHQVDGSFVHTIMSAWMPAARSLRPSLPGASVRGKPAAYKLAPSPMATAATHPAPPRARDVHVTLHVRNCRAHVRVMRDVELTYESDDKANQGLYATISHYSKPSHEASSYSALRMRGGGAGRSGAGEGRLLSQSEMCFKLHKTRLRSVKDDVGGAPLSQATFYLPDVQAGGKMNTRFNLAAADAPPGAAGAQDPLGALAPGAAGDNIPSITEVNIIFSIKEMCNEVRQDMLNFLLEMQRTMKTELNMFLRAAEKYAETLGKRREIRAKRGLQLHFTLKFLLMGIRLRAVAPDNTALLLDTGNFTFEVIGRPTGTGGGSSGGGGGGKEGKDGKGKGARNDKALKWTIRLEGLSIAATSCHQRPGMQAGSLSRELGTGLGANGLPKTWVLAHVCTNLEMQNKVDDLSLDASEADEHYSSDHAGQNKELRYVIANCPLLPCEPVSFDTCACLSTFSLNLWNTEAVAHPGSIGCLRLLYTHFNFAIAQYQHQRQFIHLEEIDSRIQRMVRTGRDAAEGRIKRAAPVLISNLCVEVAIKNTSLSLTNSHEVNGNFAFVTPSDTSPAAIFEAINLRGLSKIVSASVKYNFSKVLVVLAFCSWCAMALTFEEFCQHDARLR